MSGGGGSRDVLMPQRRVIKQIELFPCSGVCWRRSAMGDEMCQPKRTRALYFNKSHNMRVCWLNLLRDAESTQDASARCGSVAHMLTPWGYSYWAHLAYCSFAHVCVYIYITLHLLHYIYFTGAHYWRSDNDEAHCSQVFYFNDTDQYVIYSLF